MSSAPPPPAGGGDPPPDRPSPAASSRSCRRGDTAPRSTHVESPSGSRRPVAGAADPPSRVTSRCPCSCVGGGFFRRLQQWTRAMGNVTDSPARGPTATAATPAPSDVVHLGLGTLQDSPRFAATVTRLSDQGLRPYRHIPGDAHPVTSVCDRAPARCGRGSGGRVDWGGTSIPVSRRVKVLRPRWCYDELVARCASAATISADER